MPRRANIDPPVPLQLKLPESVRARLDLFLFSELEGRVPLGRYSEFFVDRMREFFSGRRLSLAPWGLPGEISGEKEVIDALEIRLNSTHHTDRG